VYELRPPALDQLGLGSALIEFASQFDDNGLHVDVSIPDRLPPLPAAVEVAAYRIALEALTNVARHSRARTCTVRLSVNGMLCLDVTDDGVGVDPGARSGVGMSSMRERAAELGGRCLVERLPAGGTRVLTELPLPAGQA
jgi:signal transduction histidine kinase